MLNYYFFCFFCLRTPPPPPTGFHAVQPGVGVFGDGVYGLWKCLSNTGNQHCDEQGTRASHPASSSNTHLATLLHADPTHFSNHLLQYSPKREEHSGGGETHTHTQKLTLICLRLLCNATHTKINNNLHCSTFFRYNNRQQALVILSTEIGCSH